MKQLDQAIAVAAKQAKKAPQVLADTASKVAAVVFLSGLVFLQNALLLTLLYVAPSRSFLNTCFFHSSRSFLNTCLTFHVIGARHVI